MRARLLRWLTAGSLTERFARASATLALAALLLTALASWLLAETQNDAAEQALVRKEAVHNAAMIGTMIEGVASRMSELAEGSLLAAALTDTSGRENYLHPYLSSIHHVNAVPVSVLFTDFMGREIASNDFAAFSDEDRQWLQLHLNAQSEGAMIRDGEQGPELIAVKLVTPPRTGRAEGALLYSFDLNAVLYSGDITLFWNGKPAQPSGAMVTARVPLKKPFDTLGIEAGIAARDSSIGLRLSQLGIIFSLTVAITVLIWWLGRRLALRLTQQLRRLESFSREVVHTGFGSLRAPVEGGDEVSSLAHSFNHVLDRLHHQHQQLQEESERRNQLLARYRLLIESTNAVSWEASLPGFHYSFVSPQMERVLGFSVSDCLSTGFWDAHVHEDDAEVVAQARAAAINGAGEYSCEYRLHNRAGEAVWVEEIGSVIRSGVEGDATLRGIILDVGQRKAAEAEIQQLAYYDPLTGLPNRRMLLDRLQRLTDAGRHDPEPGALIFIDLDNFKALNDTHGHEMGDLMLGEAAHRLTAAVRRNDIVARLGGDEFVVVLKGQRETPETFRRHAEIVADKILAVMDQPYHLRGIEHHSSASLGIYVFDTGNDTVTEILQRADLAMYQAKASGRNAIRFFEADMQFQVSRRTELENRLRNALKQQEFRLAYQPQVTDRGELLGFEVLLRWQHPERGLIHPSDFISVAEETGLIVPIGLWVIRHVAEKLKVWSADPRTSPLTLSVNVSARQFRDEAFVDQVMAVLRDTGLPHHRMNMELTESLLVDDIQQVIYKMRVLKAAGIGFSLDDFGTGYSSLSYLRRLPMDELKIDHSFFRNALTEEADAAIVRTIVVLAQSLKLRLIAEGVETERQKEFLIRHGCHAYQGFLFGEAVPEERLPECLDVWLSDQRQSANS